VNTLGVRGLSVLLLMVSLSALPACQSVEKARAEATVREYAELLPSVYARSEPGLLAEVATQAEQSRVLMYLLYLKQQGDSLDTRLIDLKVVSTDVMDEKDRALVMTNERWEYRTVDTESGGGQASFTEVEYESVYTLLRDDDAWLVSEVDVREMPSRSEQK
jgi:hypothetical protein